jgi:S1-C subfamily serine protease
VDIVEVTPSLAERFNLPVDRGIGLRDVRPGSPAEKAGLEPGDIIVKVADIEIQSSGDLFRALTEHRAGDTVAVQYYRNGKLDSTEVTLG